MQVIGLRKMIIWVVVLFLFSCSNVSGQQGLNWPNELRIGKSGTSSGLPPIGGLIRAQPGSSLYIQPYGDYRRSAIDIFPTIGKRQDLDCISEVTLHRIRPSGTGVEMISFSALATDHRAYAIVVESHGTGRNYPLSFLFVNQDSNFIGTCIEPLKLFPDGSCMFGGDVIMKSPNGTEWKLNIDDNGILGISK